MSKINSPVKLSETRIESIQDIVNLFFEYFVFFRWIYFKNNPRGNLLLFRTFLAVSLLSAIYYSIFSSFNLVIEGIDVEPIIFFVFLLTIGYWNMSSVFHKKSEHCSELYTKYLIEVSNKNEKGASLIGNLLAIKLLTLDLWGHRSFSPHFAKTLEKAITSLKDEANANELIQKVNAGKLNNREARCLLQGLQDKELE